MGAFLEFLFAVLNQFFGGLWQAISNFFLGLYQAINVGEYLKTLTLSKEGFGILEWGLAILVFLVLIGIVAGLIFLLILGIRHRTRLNFLLRHVGEDSDAALDKAAEAEAPSGAEGDGSAACSDNTATGIDKTATGSDKTPASGESRFYKLTQVDQEMAGYDPNAEPFDNEISLEELCSRFRNYACSRLHLYYEERVVRLFVAGLSSTRLIILQGISGTGKTSLPYAWGKFLENDAQIASVQPSWRDRTELFGYFNEFTKRFSETEVLKKMYQATYTNKVYFTILDEMNIARVEYYFAEMLSILEMPSRDEWVVDLVPSGWPSDPRHITDGRFHLPENMWYIGTANNDDSTFAISDKVYDRAIPINIDSKGRSFDAPDTEPLCLDYHHLEAMFADAKERYKVSQETLDKLEQLDDYVISHFRLAFGNRIVKQLRDFVPAYVACGGTELDGVDYVLTNKILRKFEGLNLAFIRDEIDGLVDYLSQLFGEDAMGEAKAYLARLKRIV